eukprot:Colp12_sorted_trinity150504_noHs@28488
MSQMSYMAFDFAVPNAGLPEDDLDENYSEPQWGAYSKAHMNEPEVPRYSQKYTHNDGQDVPVLERSMKDISYAKPSTPATASVMDPPDTYNEADKRLIKRLKNREAASRCRNRRKKLIEDLQAQVAELSLDKRGLLTQVNKLRDEVNMLRNLLVMTLKKDQGKGLPAEVAGSMPSSVMNMLREHQMSQASSHQSVPSYRYDGHKRVEDPKAMQDSRLNQMAHEATSHR